MADKWNKKICMEHIEQLKSPFETPPQKLDFKTITGSLKAAIDAARGQK